MPYLRLDQESESSFRKTTASTLPLKLITVLVVDDHALIRSAISQVLTSEPGVKLVITVQNYTEAEAQVPKLCPDIIWLDMHIADGDSIAEIVLLRKLSPDSRIMALADVEDVQEAFVAIMAGAQGYRSKQDLDPAEIMPIIHMLCRDEFVLRPRLLVHLMQRLRTAALPVWGSGNGLGNRALLHNTDFDGLAQLTTREREILQLIRQGYRDRTIAEGLHISEKTVQKHVQNILSKLGVQNRTQAAYLVHQERSHAQ
jgi:DNA-binding NarL/FixJ family response regulator